MAFKQKYALESSISKWEPLGFRIQQFKTMIISTLRLLKFGLIKYFQVELNDILKNNNSCFFVIQQ